MYPLQFIDHIRTCVLVIDPPNFIYSSLQRRFKAGYREDAVRCGGIRNRLLIPRCRSLFRHRLVKYQAKTRWRGSVCIFRNIMSISDLPRNSFGGMDKTTPSSFPSSNYSSFGHPEPHAGPSYLTPQDIQQQSKI